MPYPILKKAMPIHWMYSVLLAVVFLIPLFLEAPTPFPVGEGWLHFPSWMLKSMGFILAMVNGILLYHVLVYHEVIESPSMLPFLSTLFFSGLFFAGLGPDKAILLHSFSILLLQFSVKLYDLQDLRSNAFDSGILVFFLWFMFPPGLVFGMLYLIALFINKSFSVRTVVIHLFGFFVPFALLHWICWYTDNPQWIPSYSVGAPNFDFISGSLRGLILGASFLLFFLLGLVGYIRAIDHKAIRRKTRLQTVGLFVFGWLIITWFAILTPREISPFRFLVPALACLVTIPMFHSKRKWFVDIILVIALTTFCMVTWLQLGQ